MLLAVYLRKQLRPVIVRGRSGKRRPSYGVRGGKRIAAFVEIAPDFSVRSEIREEQAQQLEWEFICHIPAVGRSFAACMQGLCAVRKQDPHQIAIPGSKAKIEAELGVQFNIDVPHILRRGAEKAFHRCGHLLGFAGGNRGGYGLRP